ncbi:MAG: hypothetical protein EOO10_21985 [Chitinophagaceae bacterium]|nr:MAG: hypothetical protein EOO10_21985 [Chitinophagaceae bacterium]
MKILITTALLFLSLSLFAQKNIVGHYRNYFGSRIELNADSTFKYSWRFDLSYSWTKGTWSSKEDTLYFHTIPTYDTISYKNSDGSSADKLILSVDETPERFTPEQYASMGLSSGGQNMQSYPDKLFFEKGRLYQVDKGRLIVKKQKGFWGTKKKWNPWYFKSDD